jgi:hypothetical protein
VGADARRVWALAALQAVVTLSWMAYAYHQPRLLEHFGFERLAAVLAWYLALAGTTLAPLAGDASDRLVRAGGTRVPLVRAGVGLAAASFLAVAVTARAESGSALRFVLPLFVAVWIAGMTLFQAPALAILRDEGDGAALPSLATPIVVATTLPAAVWPWVESVLARLGGSWTFATGGVAVVATALALGANVDVARDREDDATAAATGPQLVGAFASGLVSALVVLVATSVVPATLAGYTSRLGATGLAAVAGVVATLGARGAARVGRRLGRMPAAAVSLGLAGLACALATVSTNAAGAGAIAGIAGLAVACSLATALPLALSEVPAGHAGLIAGLYLAGAVLGSQVPALVRATSAP